jgi:hypothetical protein
MVPTKPETPGFSAKCLLYPLALHISKLVCSQGECRTKIRGIVNGAACATPIAVNFHVLEMRQASSNLGGTIDCVQIERISRCILYV